MNPALWRRVEEIFSEALERPPEERQAFLDQACDGDDDLRREVERLLDSDGEQEGFLERAIVGGVELLESDGALDVDRRIGPYRLVRRLGFGGMGEVFLAERADREFDQQVAIKLIRPGLDSQRILERFRRERQILASLQHPNIARLLDGGTASDGRPYLVMEAIDGRPISEDCDARQLDLRERLKLFSTVCSAVQHAHQHLVVHRDLKPSNILITSDGTVKLLDFGIAKLLAPSAAETAVELTASEEWPLTLSYASPEQVRGEPITMASDVYSLGVVLFELLAGCRPFDLADLAPREAIRRICETAAPAPSSLIEGSERAAARGTSPERLRRQLHGDLDTIILKALHKDRSRRYGSVEQLAQDLQRHLDGRPVLARPDSWAYRGAKFVRRHRLGLAVAAAFLALASGSLFSRYQQAERIAQERDKAQQVAVFLSEIFSLSDPGRSRGETITARELLDAGAERIDRELRDQPLVRATLSLTIARVYRELGLFDRARELLEEALTVRQSELGPRHVDLAEALQDLGTLLHAEGEFDAAEVRYREALAMYVELLGEEATEVAGVRNDLALVLRRKERNDEAEELLQMALESYRRAFGAQHRLVASTMSNLALVLESRGERSERAQGLLREALETSRVVYGEPHPVVAELLNNLGFQLEGRGDFAAAEPLYRQALDMRRQLFDAEHPDFQESLNNLASLLFQQGDYEGAERHFREAVQAAQKRLGEDHPDVAPYLNNLAVVLNRQGDFAGAEEPFRQALAINQKHYGAEHPQVARSLANLATLLFTAGRYAEAAPLFEQALGLQRKLLGDNHKDMARSLANLALLESYRGQHRRALDLQTRAVAIRRRSLGEEHPRVARSVAEMAQIQAAAGQALEAETSYREAADMQRRLLSDEHPSLATSLTGLGEVLIDLGRAEEAEDILRRALAIRREALADDHWQIAETRSILGACRAAQQRYEEAEEDLLEGYALLEAKRGRDHRLTQAARQRLVELYEAWGKPDSARTWRG